MTTSPASDPPISVFALRRVRDQAGRSLVEFYQRLTSRDPASPFASVGAQMLQLLPPLATHCAALDVWGLTSHEELWLLPRDDYRAPWLVSILAVASGGYRIRYRLPDHEAPWPNAHIEGTAADVEQALAMIATAMDRCRGWTDRQSSRPAV